MNQTIKKMSRWMVPLGVLVIVGAGAAKPAQAGTWDDVFAILDAVATAQSQESGGYQSYGYESNDDESFVYEDPSDYANDTFEEMQARHARERAYEARSGYSSSSSDYVPPYRYTPPGSGSMTSGRYGWD